MNHDFDQFIKIPRIPSSTVQTARQAINILKRVENIGDLEDAKQSALDAILNVGTSDAPSELKRLRLLYKEVYTEKELKEMIEDTFQLLGIDQS